MTPLLALLAGRHVTKAYRTTRGWNTAREHGTHYLTGLWHGALLVLVALVVLVALG